MFLKRLFSRADSKPPSSWDNKLLEYLGNMEGVHKTLERRVDDLEDEQKHLTRRLNKLQGRMTGGIRTENQAEQDADGEPDAPLDIDERIRQGLPI